MPGDGERGGEGRENSEKDSFESFAEELEKKQRKDRSADEPIQDATDSVVTPQKLVESPEADEETKKDEFESYAKELRKKYDEEEGRADSPPVGQSSSREEDKITTQKWQTSKSTEPAPEEQGQESSNLNPRQTSNSAPGDTQPKSVGSGRYQLNEDNGWEKMGAQTTSPSSEPQSNSHTDKSDSEKAPPKPDGTVELSSQVAPKIAPTADSSTKDQSIEGGNTQNNAGEKLKNETQTTTESHQNEETRPAKPAEPNVVERHLTNGRRVLEPANTSDQSIPKVTEKESTRIDILGPREVNKVAEHLREQSDANHGVDVLRQSNPERETREWRTLIATVHREGAKNLRLDFPKTVLEEIYGQKFESGKVYEIDWAVNGVGRFTTRFARLNEKYPRPYIHLPGKVSHSVEVGEKVRVLINSIKETDKKEEGRFRVVPTRAGPTVRLPAEFLKSLGLGPNQEREHRRATVEFLIEKLSNSDMPLKRYFRNYEFGGRLDIRVKSIGLNIGDAVKVSGGKLYEIDGMVDDFNSHKPKGLENVSLNISRGDLLMEIDGRKFRLENPILETRLGPKVTLRASTEGGGKPIKFAFNGKDISVYFGTSRIIGVECAFKISYMGRRGPQEEIRFVRSNPEALEATAAGPHALERTLIPPVANLVEQRDVMRDLKYPRLAYHIDKNMLVNRIEPGRPTENTVGSYSFKIDSIFQEHIQSKLHGVEPAMRKQVKGRIAEQICSHLLSMTDRWNQVVDHPFGANGPDSLQRSKDTNELCLFYFKWWEDIRSAYLHELRQAKERRVKYETYRGFDIKGAYMGILEWDSQRRDMRLHVKKIEANRPDQHSNGTTSKN